METALLALCCCALSLVLALFVSISPITTKQRLGLCMSVLRCH